MTTNSYFNHLTYKPEQNFFEDFVIENIQIAGMDIWYLPREYVSIDPILREPYKSSFDSAYKIEMMCPEMATAFGGANDVMSKFGFKMEQTASFIVSTKRFMSFKIPGRELRPREGDILHVGDGYNTFTNTYFEINHVGRDVPNWPLGKFYTYTMDCSLAAWSYEPVNTGVPEIDAVDDGLATANETEVDYAINKALTTQKQTLVNFDEKNPFGNY